MAFPKLFGVSRVFTPELNAEPPDNAVFGKIVDTISFASNIISALGEELGDFFFPCSGDHGELSTRKTTENNKRKGKNARQPKVVYRRRIVVCKTKEKGSGKETFPPHPL